MKNEQPILLSEMIRCLSQAVDLVSPVMADHHKRVAHIAVSIARKMELPEKNTRDLAITGALHDVGGLSLAMRLDALQFESHDAHQHAALGYLLLKTFQPFARAARIVRFHHVDWENGAGAVFCDEPVPLESHIIHLADKVAVLLNPDDAVLTQARIISDRIVAQSGKMFLPELTAAFHDVASREHFWLEAVFSDSETILARAFGTEELGWDEDLSGLTRLICRVIDFRSRFTATHTRGVAASAVALATLSGFSETDCSRMEVAGCIHDLGKLAVPAEILEKRSALSEKDFDIVKTHTYHTDNILKSIKGFDTIRTWGALHHERLDGSGYPFHLTGKDLPTGSRIVAVADAFVALTENRPYRNGLSREEVLMLLRKMVHDAALDKEIVEQLADNFEEINSKRIEAQDEATVEYRNFISQARQLEELCDQRYHWAG
jgi:HD-GYP domain-containing protein (c-di-GMP phosphodiesterase class II)